MKGLYIEGGGALYYYLVRMRHCPVRIIIALRGRLNQNRSRAHSQMGRVPHLYAVMKIWKGGGFDRGPHNDDI